MSSLKSASQQLSLDSFKEAVVLWKSVAPAEYAAKYAAKKASLVKAGRKLEFKESVRWIRTIKCKCVGCQGTGQYLLSSGRRKDCCFRCDSKGHMTFDDCVRHCNYWKRREAQEKAAQARFEEKKAREEIKAEMQRSSMSTYAY